MTKFKLLRQLPEIQNELYSVFYVEDGDGNVFYAKIFSINKLQQYGLDESLQYNEEVLSDLDGIAFPQNINKITMSIPNDGMFTFITEPYESNLENYMRTGRITELQALRIFDNILKAVYSIYANGYWHKSIRPEHFVRINNVWKLDSLVYAEDYKKNINLQSEYIWDPEYQPPECYQRNIQKFTDEEFLPIVVWNLGSLLLDLFFSVHKLKSYQILKCYKGKKFTLENIKVKKTDLFSKKLKEILSSMLHYNPKERMRLEEVFSNQYLSKQVSMLFKVKHKNSLSGAPIKIFTGGKSALSSALQSREQRQKGDKVLPINEMVKSAIQNIQGGINKLNTERQHKSLYQPDTDEDSGGKTSMADIFQKFLSKKDTNTTYSKDSSKNSSKNDSSINNQFSSVIRIYQTMIDKSELLSVSGDKFSQIDYKEFRKEMSLLSKYSVQILSYFNLRNIINNLDNNVNSLGLQNNVFVKFQTSSECQGLKNMVRQKLEDKQQKIQQVKQSIDQLSNYQRKLTEEKQVRQFIVLNFKSTTYTEIKVCYRKIIKISYDLVTREYNKNSKNEKLARLAMYVVYCLTIDKLYLPNLLDKNFLPFFQWCKEKPSPFISSRKFQKYIEEADSLILVIHAKELLERFFKL